MTTSDQRLAASTARMARWPLWKLQAAARQGVIHLNRRDRDPLRMWPNNCEVRPGTCDPMPWPYLARECQVKDL